MSLVDWEPDSDYETLKSNKSPEEATRILNEAAKWYCEHEITTETKEK